MNNIDKKIDEILALFGRISGEDSMGQNPIFVPYDLQYTEKDIRQQVQYILEAK